MLKIFIAAILLSAGVLFAEDLLQFDKANFRLAGKKVPGLELLKPETPNRKALILRWGNPPPVIFICNSSPKTPKISKFDEAVFTLNVDFPEPVQLSRIVIRLRDATGEIFQFHNKVTGKFSGKMKLNYRVADDGTFYSCWGGNKNKKFDWPITFSEVAIDCSKKTLPGAKIIFESVELQKKGENLSVSLETGHRLNLLLPGRKEAPGLMIRNTGTDDVAVAGILNIEDGFGKVRKYAVSAAISQGKRTCITIPGDYSGNGCWKVKYRLISGANKEYTGERRFARMDPAGPTPERAKEFLFGMCCHIERFSGEKPELEAMAAGLCGAKIMRFDFVWAYFQPERNRWNFAKYDKIIQILAKNGVEPQATLGYSVRWAEVPDYPMKNPKLKGRPKFVHPELYAAFCGKLAGRYKENIRYFELWNEPDLTGFANFDFSKYMELLSAGYNAIKKNAPNSKIMNGGIATIYSDSRSGDNNGWAAFLKKNAGKHFDLFAFHGHGSLENYLLQLDLLEQKGLIGKKASRPWYSNETAQTSAHVTETEQAAILFKKLLSAWARGAMGYNWYLLREKGEHYPAGHPERHFGLLTTEFEPKPAYITYNMLAKNYQNGKYLGAISTYPDVTVYRFKGRNGEELAALWNNIHGHSQTVLATLPPGTVKVDLFGDETPVKLNNGVACIQVSSIPFTLKAPRGRGKIKIERGFLQPGASVQFVLEPGKTRKIVVPLVNPMKKKLTLNLKVASPASVSVSPKIRTFSMKPEEKINAEFIVHAGSDFSAPPTSPEKIQADLFLNNVCIEKITLSLIRKTKAGEPMFLLKRSDQYISLIPAMPGNERFYWKGTDDLSAKIYLSRKGNILSLKAEVTDDSHCQSYTKGAIWKGDSIQFGLAVPGQNGFWKFGLAHLDNKKTEVYCWNYPIGFSDPSKAIKLKTSRNEKTKRTVYEASIPFSVIGLNPGFAAKGIGFNLIVNDNDGKMREGFLAAAPGMGISDESSRWIMVTLD